MLISYFFLEDEIKGAKKGDSARMIISFECSKCNTRNTKMCTKRAYEKGLVVIRCDGCDALHLIADNLGWFDKDKKTNIEEILKERGETATKLSLEDLLKYGEAKLSNESKNTLSESNIVSMENIEKEENLKKSENTNSEHKPKKINKYKF